MTDTTASAPVEQPTAASGSEGLAETAKSNTVAYETYLKTVDEAKKAKARLRELELAEKARLEKELADQGEYKKLLTARDEELNSLKEKLAFTQKQEQDRKKLASILNSAGGDIDPKFYSLIPYEEVVINPDSGEIDQMSVAKAVENLKKSYPEIIRNPNGPRLPADAPSGHGLRITRSEWLALPYKEMRKWKMEQITD